MGEHEARQKHQECTLDLDDLVSAPNRLLIRTYYVATRNPSYTPLSSAAQALGDSELKCIVQVVTRLNELTFF